MLKISIFVYFLTHFFIYFNVSYNALTCIQDSNKNKNKNENKLSIKIKKIKLKQVVFKFIANLNKISLKFFFAKFYNFAIKSLCNFELLTRLSNNNVINFYFTFVCASLTYIFLKNKEREDVYRRQKQVCNKNKKNCANRILCNVTFLRERKCFEQLRRLVYK